MAIFGAGSGTALRQLALLRTLLVVVIALVMIAGGIAFLR